MQSIWMFIFMGLSFLMLPYCSDFLKLFIETSDFLEARRNIFSLLMIKKFERLSGSSLRFALFGISFFIYNLSKTESYCYFVIDFSSCFDDKDMHLEYRLA